MPEMPTTLTLTLDWTPILRRARETPDGDWIDEPVTIEEVLLDAAVDRVVDRLDAEIMRGLAQRARQIRDEVIREEIEPLIREALSGPIMRTNSYGEPISGSETTLRDVIMDHARRALTLQPQGSRSTYDLPAATKVLREQVDLVVTKEVKAIVDAVKAETYERIRAAAADQIAKAATTGARP